MLTENRIIDQHKRRFMEFIGSDDNEDKYPVKLRNTIRDKKYRFIVNINDIRAMENDFAASIIKRPREYMLALQEAAVDSAKNLDPSFDKLLKTNDLQVGFEGSLGCNSVSPRGLV
jgi:DNA replicative helicase MCM subunit Mcm2 (Cdc46/Mcm family)